MPNARAQLAVHPQQSVVESDHLIEEADILESSRNTGARSHFGSAPRPLPDCKGARQPDQSADQKGNRKSSACLFAEVTGGRVRGIRPEECLLINVIRGDGRFPKWFNVYDQHQTETRNQADQGQRKRGCPTERAARFLAIEANAAAGGIVDARDRVEERGLARAVGTDDRNDSFCWYIERHGVDGGKAAEAHGEVGYFENVHAVGGECGSPGCASA